MDGGEGDNTITKLIRRGSSRLRQLPRERQAAIALELGGDGDATAGTGANAYAYGMRAGSGADYLYNYGTIGVTAASTLTDSSSAYTLFGSEYCQLE